MKIDFKRRGRTKEAFYDAYLNRSESLDWADFQEKTRTKKTSIKRDEVASVIDDDVDGTAGQLQSAPAGPAPRITIRYNDPGSLESVIRFRLMTRERVH